VNDEHKLRAFLKDRFRNYNDSVDSNENLGDIVDSLGLFELVEFVEREFQVAVPTAQFTPQRFSSIQGILDFVAELRADA
jgi:acyl carrier protein